MRIATALLLLLVALPALAQPCDPSATDEICPDTTDWHRYFPLAVGNQWQYYQPPFEEPETHWSWTIIGQTEVDGQTYFELERCDEAADGSATCDEPLLLRYDDEHELIALRTDGGEVWWDVLPCNIGGAFNTGTFFDEPQECTGLAAGFVPVSTLGDYGATVTVPPDEVTGDTRKEFTLYPDTGPELYAGLGVTKYYYDLQENPTRLVYANVGGEQVGTPAFASCDPSNLGDDDVCPDTTDWRRYLPPLAVGNQWQYDYDGFCGNVGDPPCNTGMEVVGSEVIDGVEFFLVRSCVREIEGDITCSEPRLRNYDTLSPDESPGCLLSLPFNSIGIPDCEEFGLDYFITGRYDGVFSLGEGPSIEGTRKQIDSIGGVSIHFAGVGRILSAGDFADGDDELVYARINGVEYGTPEFTFPTSSEPETAQPVATGFIAAFPNPARDAMRAEFTLAEPQTVTLELVDLLGRRVRETELGPQPAGAHDLRLDLGGLRPGLYVLRLRGDAGAEATRRVVVVQ